MMSITSYMTSQVLFSTTLFLLLDLESQTLGLSTPAQQQQQLQQENPQTTVKARLLIKAVDNWE